MADFVETIRATLSNDNTLRDAAEKRYTEAQKEQPAVLVAGLFQILMEPQLEMPLREQGAVLLRKCLEHEEKEPPTTLFAALGEAVQTDVKAKLLQLLEAEPVDRLRRKIADCVQAVGHKIIEVSSDQRPTNCAQWPELMPRLMQAICDATRAPGIRADCLWIVKELCTTIWPVLVASSAQTVQVLGTTLKDASHPVCAHAAALFCELVDNIEKKQERTPLYPLLPEVAGAMARVAEAEDQKPLDVVLMAMQSTTEIADFFKDHLMSHFMPLLCTIAKQHREEDSRKLALECIVCFVEGKPKAVVRTPNYLEQALEVCLTFIMRLDDDLESWAKQDEDDAEEDEAFAAGKEAVDRIAKAANKVELFHCVLEVLKVAITKLFQSGEWKQTVAGLAIFAQIAEYVDDDATVGQIAGAVKMQLRATNPRVRYEAWAAFLQCAEFHGETLASDTWAQQLMPEFVLGLDDTVPRVAAHCMEVFPYYGESVERDDMEPFVQALMEKLGMKLQGAASFRSKAITFIAVIAGQIDDSFAPYYGPLMPILKQIIEQTLHKVEERTLLGKCFECISLLAKAVGKSGFRGDVEAIMQAMISATKVPDLPSNDPVKEYMMAASERICATMKEDFLPFVPHILPQVLERLRNAPQEFNAETTTEGLEEGQEINLMFSEENGKVKIMVMSSSAMDDLKNSLECIHTFVEELGKSYAPYVAETAQAVLPVFEFDMAEHIRDQAFDTWGQLCNAARESGTVDLVRQLVMEFLNRVLPKISDLHVDAQKTRADGVTTCLKKSGPGLLDAPQVRHISELTLRVLQESLQRREAASQAKKAKGAGEDEDEEDEDLEADEKLRISLCEIAGAVMQHHPDLFVDNGLADYLQLVQKLLQNGSRHEDRKLGIFVACDFLEHLNNRVTQHWPLFMPQLLEDVHSPQADLRQPACYGTFLAARDPAFAPAAPTAAAKLVEVVTQSRARGKKKSERQAQACADNALSALAEILMKHSATVAGSEAQLWSVWLGGLPCQEDEMEGARNHKLLLQLMQQQRPEVVGSGGENLPRLLTILVDIYKTEMVDDEANLGIQKLVQSAGQERLEQYAASFSDKQKKKLLRIFREAQQPSA